MAGTSGNPKPLQGQRRPVERMGRSEPPAAPQPPPQLSPPPAFTTQPSHLPPPWRGAKPSAHVPTSEPPPSPAPTFHVSLPLALPRSLGSSSAATIGYRTSSSRPINATPSPPCYWVEQNKNKQSERGQRRSEAAAEAEEWGRGPADQRPGRAVAARGDSKGRLPFSNLRIISASEIKEKWM